MKEVSFVTAKLANKKSFYFGTKKRYTRKGTFEKPMNQGWSISAPIQSELHGWLRDVHNIIVEIVAFYEEHQLPLTKENLQKPAGYFAWDHYDENFSEDKAIKFSSYEQAMEHGLVEGLKLVRV